MRDDMHFYLGKVFLSHTSVDKPFVRRLAARLKKEQFDVWLDEHDLIAGDPLPESIGKALEAARVILVIVSKTSIASKWLRYELNIATEKMISGKCRVIPVVIDDAPLPAEVRGLLYADCRTGLASGISSILTVLKHEARQAQMQHSFSSRVNKLVDEVFGGRGFVGPTSYRTQDWETVAVPVDDIDGYEQDAFYDTITDYRKSWGGKREPLDENELNDLRRGIEDTEANFALIISERQVQFKLDLRSPTFPNVGIRRFGWEQSGSRPKMISLQIVLVDFSQVSEEGSQKVALREARALLTQCGEYKNAEVASLRALVTKASQ